MKDNESPSFGEKLAFAVRELRMQFCVEYNRLVSDAVLHRQCRDCRRHGGHLDALEPVTGRRF